MTTSLASSDGDASSSGSAHTLLTGLQALTRRLQDERDALQHALDDATRALQSERAAKAALEHALQVRELELLHVTQQQAAAAAQLRERVAQLERELEDERAQVRAAVAARVAATQKSSALSTELKQAELKWRKEMEKKELALAEIDILRDDALALTLDREQLVQRTEADAKRVRELWQQIAREHASKRDALRQELDATKQTSAALERVAAQHESKARELEASTARLAQQNAALQERLASASEGDSARAERVEAERERDRQRSEQAYALSLQLQELKSEAALATQREAAATREHKLAAAVLSKCQRELDAKTEELLALKSEFGDLVDKIEQLRAERALVSRETAAAVEMRVKRLARGKRCAEELAALRTREVAGYKQVLQTVSRKLDDVTDAQAAIETSAWLLPGERNGSAAQSSLCIYRH
ncbi:hypothetical protein PybrP1_007142 [[Pythium] brassicae (nom. inval.)]|nr:hypothetical protein PybrP1_007142 [[Pythium] brassicae (nom. inval.)]